MNELIKVLNNPDNGALDAYLGGVSVKQFRADIEDLKENHLHESIKESLKKAGNNP